MCTRQRRCSGLLGLAAALAVVVEGGRDGGGREAHGDGRRGLGRGGGVLVDVGRAPRGGVVGGPHGFGFLLARGSWVRSEEHGR